MLSHLRRLFLLQTSRLIFVLIFLGDKFMTVENCRREFRSGDFCDEVKDFAETENRGNIYNFIYSGVAGNTLRNENL